MIVDTSALLAILLREPGFEAFVGALGNAPTRSMSAASFVELSVVIESRGGDPGIRQSDALFRSAKVSILPVTEEQAYIARQAYSTYGKGRHRANLNFGDCFSYALAKATGEPLLFKGDDFRQTDVQPALS